MRIIIIIQSIFIVFVLKIMLGYLFSYLGINLLILLIPALSMCIYNIILLFNKKDINILSELNRLFSLFIKLLIVTLLSSLIIKYIGTNLLPYLYLEDSNEFIIICMIAFIVQNIQDFFENAIIRPHLIQGDGIGPPNSKELFISTMNMNPTSDDDSSGTDYSDYDSNDSGDFDTNFPGPRPYNNPDTLYANDEVENDPKNKGKEKMPSENDPKNKGKEKMPSEYDVRVSKAKADKVLDLIGKTESKVSDLEDLDKKCEKIIKDNNLTLMSKGEKLTVTYDDDLGSRKLKRVLKTLKEHEKKWHEVASEVNKDMFEINDTKDSIPHKKDAGVKEEVINPLKRKFDSLEERFDKNQTSFLSKVDSDSDSKSESEDDQ